MHSLRNVEELFSRVTEIRTAADQFTTNLYAMPSEIQSWFVCDELKFLDRDGCLLLIRSDRSLVRLYHAARNEQALAEALSALDFKLPEPLIAEVVGRSESTAITVDTYRSSDFQLYTTLARMTRSMQGEAASDNTPADKYANVHDALQIAAFLQSVLDPVRDHAPSLAEIEDAVASQRVLVEKLSHAILGVLFFEEKTSSSVLRYWYVDPAHCNEGIGGRLMKKYLRHCRGKSRIVLWVVSDNPDAIRKYRHYGFEFDGLSDHIMLRKKGNTGGNSRGCT